jgi:hypothetical protein
MMLSSDPQLKYSSYHCQFHKSYRFDMREL